MFVKIKRRKAGSYAPSFSKDTSFLEWFSLLLPIIAFVFLFGAFFLRLFSLTIVKGQYYKKLADNNRLKEIVVEAPRGRIYDRKGYLIAESIKGEEKEERVVSKRYYRSSAASHFVGYVQEPSEKEIKEQNCFYTINLKDKVGKTGVENLLDCVLRGNNGKKLVEVDAFGRRLREIAYYPEKPGIDLKTSLDLKLQEAAREAIVKRGLENKKIAIVGVKPSTGEVLLYLSYPDFDPNAFENDPKLVKTYLASKDRPLFDRVANGAYPPGSTFKPFVAIAGLEEKVIDEKTLIEDTGVIKLGPQTFGNWYFLEYGKKEGKLNVIRAIARSNDIFFYKTGEKLGEKKIRDWAIRFGFSKLTNIGFPENPGVVPSDFWKKSVLGERWYLGDTYNLSIGQGYLLVTPLQMTMATAAIAENGKPCKPIILKPVSENKNLPLWAKESIEPFSTPSCKDLNISQKTLNLVKEGMRQACKHGGTAFPFFDFEVEVGCKTGTAQSERPSGLPHAWFTVFAPFKKPEIALTVLVEEGGQGSEVAAPLAKDILKFYFERQD